MNFVELPLDQSVCYGNVELKPASGTLPQRLTIEKLVKRYVISGSYDTFYVFLEGNRMWMTRSRTGGTYPWLVEVDPETLNILQQRTDNELANYQIFGKDASYLYLWSGNYIKKVRLSDFGTELTSAAVVGNVYCPPFLALNAIYCGTGWPGILRKISKADLSIIEDFGSVLNYRISNIYTEDEDIFWAWRYIEFAKYSKSSDKILWSKKQYGETDDLANSNFYFSSSPPDFLMLRKKFDGNFCIVAGLKILFYDAETCENRKLIILPSKVGRFDGYEGVPSSYCLSFDMSESYIAYFPFKGIWGYYTQEPIFVIRWGDNTFSNSYAEFTKDLLPGSVLKKIIVEGGFSKGYSDSYADAQQIRVQYWDGTGWVEYDLDALPDINLQTNQVKIRIGLQDRYLASDRFPYVSKVGILYDPPYDTTPPAKPEGISVDLPPSRPTGLNIEEASDGGGLLPPPQPPLPPLPKR